MSFLKFFRSVAVLILCVLCSTAQAGAYEEMLQAIHIDDDNAVAALLRRGMDVDTVSPRGETLLMQASREGKPHVVKTILAARPKLNARNPQGESALMLAAILGHTEIVRLLVDAGAPVNHGGWTPLIRMLGGSYGYRGGCGNYGYGGYNGGYYRRGYCCRW